MPLSANVDGELVCAPLMPDDRWAALRGERVVLQPCGHPGFARVSGLGTRHFVHTRDSDCHPGESAEHLHLKAVVARAVADAGWTPGTEVPGPGFVADVLATHDSRRVAIEVQRSKQVLRQYRERQDTYNAAGVRAVWLVRSIPAGHLDGPELPLFLVTDWVGQEACVVVGRKVPVPALVTALLSGKCHWQDTVDAQRRLTGRVALLCPVCGRRREVVVDEWLQGRCTCGLPVLRPAPARTTTDARCCGYWGPALAIGLRRNAVGADEPVAHGHWCLSA